METFWWNWYCLFSRSYHPSEIPASTARTRHETIANSFFNPDAGRNSPADSADFPQRNVLPPQCLTLRLFFLKLLYPFQRCSIRSLPSSRPPPATLPPPLSFHRCPKSSIRFSASRPSFILPLFSPCYPQVGLLAFIVEGSRFSSFYFSISRRMRFSSSFPLRRYRRSVDEQSELREKAKATVPELYWRETNREWMDERNEKGYSINLSAVSVSAPLRNTICSNDSETD